MYEYRVVEKTGRQGFEKDLNKLAQDGWELVVFKANGSGVVSYFYALLRQEVG